MKVRLVGTNVDLAALRRALEAGDHSGFLATPEPIAAAYARVSRSPKSIDDLRAEAHTDVEKARRSNRSIVFDMGHASIAEHAVFNFDIEGVSRLAIEMLEHTRLASYTERSQRYVLIGEDLYTPPEIDSDRQLAGAYRQCVRGLFRSYEELYGKLLAVHMEGAAQPVKRRRRVELETAAREDARYLLPLAATGQLGMTVNARSLETTVRRLKADTFDEARELGRRLEEEAMAVTPSLIRYTEPSRTEACLESGCLCSGLGGYVDEPGGVRLVSVTPEGDRLVAGMMEGFGAGGDSKAAGRSPVDGFFMGATQHDRAPRCFEFVDLVFELVCSASCFAQLKRHRMASLLAGPYEPALGVVVPPSVTDAGLGAGFLGAIEDAAPLYARVAATGKPLAGYLLTNAHCRRVLLKMNLRELHHFSRLRMDGHAQWEIRDLAGKMCRAAADRLPLSARYLGGKDRFEESVAGE